MRALKTKLRIFDFHFLPHSHTVFHLSSSNNLSKPSHPHITTQQQVSNSDIDVSRSLFNEITEILGSDTVFPDHSPFGSLFPFEIRNTRSGFKEKHDCTEDVCENAEESVGVDKTENFPVLEDTRMSKMGEEDICRMVGEITEIIRAENDLVSLEERLENMDYCELNVEVFDRVLKRCFKMPCLGLRVFNWLKVKDGFSHTTRTYNTMLCLAGEAKEFGLVKKLVGEMDECGVPKDVNTWTILISLYGKAKKISEALLAFENMQKCGCEPDVVSYKTATRMLCSSGKGDIAMEFYNDMVRKDIVLDDLRLYKMLMNCMAKPRDVAAVSLLGNDMMQLCLMPKSSVLGCMLKSFCISGKIKEALELIRDLKYKDVVLEPGYFETLVRGLCKEGRISDALEIVEIMKRKDIVDGNIHGIIINGYLRRNDVRMALDVFQNMKESGYVPTVSTYTELIQHLFRLSRYEEACVLYDEMLGKGIKPDIVAITAMVAGHVSQNRISKAVRKLRKISPYY